MRIKRTLSIAIICVLMVTALSAAMVYAPPPEDLILPQLLNAFITNTDDDPVPVDITDDAIDVNMDEPIEVTNPSGESLDVEVTNNLDVSGWLHTTRDLQETTWIRHDTAYPMDFDTRGYRTVTVVIAVDVEARVSIEWDIAWDFYSFEEQFEITGFSLGTSRTYDVRGHTMGITIFALNEGEEGEARLGFYMTT